MRLTPRMATLAGCAAFAIANLTAQGVASTPRAIPLREAVAGFEMESGVLADTDRLIAATAEQVGRVPTSSSLDLLARLHLRRGRITGDAASYARATDVVAAARRAAPNDT